MQNWQAGMSQLQDVKTINFGVVTTLLLTLREILSNLHLFKHLPKTRQSVTHKISYLCNEGIALVLSSVATITYQT